VEGGWLKEHLRELKIEAMAENKRQHFVPQLLQRCFSTDSKTIGEYLIDEDRCIITPIATTAQMSNFYKVNEQDKTSIEKVYGIIEDSVGPILKRIQKRDFGLNDEEIECLFLFVVSQLMRSLKAAKAMGAILEFCDKKRIKVVQEEIESGFRNHENLPMQSSLGIPSVAEYMSGKGFVFVSNDTPMSFLLSDNPACLISPVAELAIEKQIWDRMMVQEPFSGYMLYLPLGPNVGIICFDDDYYTFGKDICVMATERDVQMLNALEVINANKYVLFLDGTFNKEDVVEALQARRTEKVLNFEESIYTPINKSFSLSWLKIDEEVLTYLINRYAIEKPKKNSLIDVIMK